MANNVYKKKMDIKEAINDLRIYLELYPHDAYSNAIETTLWLLNNKNMALSEAQELYNEGYMDGYKQGHHEIMRREKISGENKCE